jgi:hypothetical protein
VHPGNLSASPKLHDGRAVDLFDVHPDLPSGAGSTLMTKNRTARRWQ